MSEKRKEPGVPVMIRIESALESRLEAVAQKSGQTYSAVIRAAARLGLRALEVKPEMVRQIEAGTMDSGTLGEFVTRFALLCGYRVNPQTEPARALAAGQETQDWMERVGDGLPLGGGLSKGWRKAIIEDLPEILSSDAARAVIRHEIEAVLAKLQAAEFASNPVHSATNPSKRKARKP
jgi:predicted transcriptional regulator